MNKITLTIPNISTNRLYTTHRHTGKRILTRQARAIKEAMAWEAKYQYRKPEITREFELRVDLYYPDRRRRDGDNIKGLLDAMTGILWKDDSLIVAHMVRKHVRPGENPRIELSFPYDLP